jgi:ubiquinone/menaquinone biosynthesis C-methylase UbiE
MAARSADYLVSSLAPGARFEQGSTAGFERLKVLARVMQDPTAAFLDRVGVPSGARCLDVGCGAGDVSFELASRVGKYGRVVGVDLDLVNIELARRDAEPEGLADQVDFRLMDVLDLPEHELFDLVHARFLLSHVREPASILAKFVRLLRPGGLVVLEEVDFAGTFCEPPNEAHERYVQLYTQAVQSKGVDPSLGRCLPRLMREAALTEIQVEVVQPMALRGEIKLFAPIAMKNIAEAVIGGQLATAQEVDGILAELMAFSERPDTLMGMPRVVQVCGRKL